MVEIKCLIMSELFLRHNGGEKNVDSQEKRFAVYTVITGGFDGVKQPLVIDDRFDYILFTDKHIEEVGVWSVKLIDFDSPDLRLKSRFPKLCSHLCLGEYEASLYIDGTIQITSQYVYDRCIELYESGIEWAGMKHQARNYMIDEINAIIGLAWVHDYEVIDWYKFLKIENFKDDLGLFENNIIYRRHTDNVKNVNNIWWWSIEKYRFRRDQFSLMYVLSKVPEIKIGYFLPPGQTAWENDGHFLYTYHNPHKRDLKRTAWEIARNRCARVCFKNKNKEYGIFTDMFDNVIKYKHYHLAMHCWTLYVIIRYGYIVIYEMIKLRHQLWTKK